MLHLGTVLVLLQPTPLHPSSIVAFSSVPELADPRIVASTSSIFLFLFKTARLMHLSLARHFGEAVRRIEVPSIICGLGAIQLQVQVRAAQCPGLRGTVRFSVQAVIN
jgi:hypothetical protein